MFCLIFERNKYADERITHEFLLSKGLNSTFENFYLSTYASMKLMESGVLENMKKVTNPLTIIAIFSTITEISGTVVLPLVDAEHQGLFIWFVMLFPTVLIIMFFLTLNWNHKVLYAPSDYQSDSSFIEMSKVKDSEMVLANKPGVKNGISIRGISGVSND